MVLISKSLFYNQDWKLNNLTSAIHYSLGVSFNYSWLVLLFIPFSSCWLLIIHNSIFIIPDFPNPNIHYSLFIFIRYSLFIIQLPLLILQLNSIVADRREVHDNSTTKSSPLALRTWTSITTWCKQLRDCLHQVVTWPPFNTLHLSFQCLEIKIIAKGQAC